MAIGVDVVGIAFEARVIIVAHGLPEVDESLRSPEMLLATLAKTVLSAGRECGLGRINRIDRIGWII